jgi:DNA-directed RNA polymerase subunit F
MTRQEILATLLEAHEALDKAHEAITQLRRQLEAQRRYIEALSGQLEPSVIEEIKDELSAQEQNRHD